MRKVQKYAMLSLSLIMIIISACSSSGSKTTTSTTTPAATTAAATPTASQAPKDKPITITYWVDPRFQFVKGLEDKTKNFGDWEKIQAAEFIKTHPNVIIEVQALTWDDMGKKVPVSITAGSNPDILRDYLGRTAQYAYQGVLEDLENAVPKADLDDYIPSYIKQYTINGHLHALPSYAWAMGIVLNKQVWKDKGQDNLLPTFDNPYWSFDQFEKALLAVKDKGVVPYSIHVAAAQGDQPLMAFFWGFGAKFFKDGDYSKSALNSPEAVKALEYLAKLNDQGLLEPAVVSSQTGDLDNLFISGKVGAYGNTLGLWSIVDNAKKEGKTKANFDLQIVQVPNDGSVKNGLPVGPTGLAVFKQKDEAKRKVVIEFANFLNSAEYQKQYALNAGQFPVRKSSGVPMENDPNYKVLQKIITERGVEDMGITHPKFAEFRPLLQPEVQAVLLKKKTAAQALKDYEAAVNKILSAK